MGGIWPHRENTSMVTGLPQCRSIPINTDQCQIKQNWSGIDRQWSLWETFRILISSDRILAPCNYCHHPWYVGHKSYHKALLIMFGCDGISDHANWNEVFHYKDTKLSCMRPTFVSHACKKTSIGKRVRPGEDDEEKPSRPKGAHAGS